MVGAGRGRTFDVIVVGSGFGGSACAARLAQRGMRVLILERGPWWGPLNRHRPAADRREFPRGPLGIRKLVRGFRYGSGRRRREWLIHADGLQELHIFDHLNVITGSAVGGGSHLYTAILEEPASEYFDDYPRELTGRAMRPFFERVRAMLRPARAPAPPPKAHVFARAVRAAGLPEPESPELAIAWGKDPHSPEPVLNAAGIEQRTSTLTGDVFVGCVDGSKTTLDLTYVPVALQHGAELRPLCEVLAVTGAEHGGYRAHYRDHRTGQVADETAPRLVLAAGGLNTQRLLFDARDGHGGLPRLPRTLGHRFSPNADHATLLWNTRALRNASHGPSLSAFSRITRAGSHRFLVAEVSLPAAALAVPASLRRRLDRSTFLFAMGRDASSATTSFDGRGLTTAADRSIDPELYAEIEAAVDRVAREYGAARVFSNFLAGRGPEGLFSVHPLGGCSIGTNPDDGFTDHLGQVFGHPGLFVADGSLYRRSPGIGPSMTIAALAERQAELMP